MRAPTCRSDRSAPQSTSPSLAPHHAPPTNAPSPAASWVPDLSLRPCRRQPPAAAVYIVMTTVKPGCYQRKRRTAWSGCGLGDGRSVGRFVCCAACVLSSCDIGGRCVSTTHQHTLVARGGLGLARNTHRHTYTHYTHYTHTGTHNTHTHTHTHTTHTHDTHLWAL